jgi:hypothetical protein
VPPDLRQQPDPKSTFSPRACGAVAVLGEPRVVERTFRDEKNLHFGMGLSATHIHDGARRNRLLLLAAIAPALLTLLGAASEAAGLDRYLKVNTVKRRTHSLYRQGLYWTGTTASRRCARTGSDR